MGRAAHWTVDVAIRYIGTLFLSRLCGYLIEIVLTVDDTVILFQFPAMVLSTRRALKHLIHVTIAVTYDGSLRRILPFPLPTA